MKKMKFIAVALTAGMLLTSVTACTGGNSGDDVTVVTTEATQATAESKQTEESEVTSESQESDAAKESGSEATESSADTTPSQSEEPTEADSGKTYLEGDSQTYANTFITNFVEQDFFCGADAGKFNVETAPVMDVLPFVYYHVKINDYKAFSNDKKGECSYVTLSVDKCRDILGKYMMYNLSEDDCKELPEPYEEIGDGHNWYWGPFYADGKIWFESGDGEAYNDIGVVDYVKSEEDGNMTLFFTIYEIDFDVYNELTMEQVKEYYKISPAKAAEDKTLIKKGTGEANVAVGQSGKYFINTYEVKMG